jgi:hypothetical protein
MKKIGYYILIWLAFWFIAYLATGWVFYAIGKATYDEKSLAPKLDSIGILVSALIIIVSVYTIQSGLKRHKFLLDINKVRLFWGCVRTLYGR